jgi:hypothetical protein
MRFVENLIAFRRPRDSFRSGGVVKVNMSVDHVLYLGKRALISGEGDDDRKEDGQYFHGGLRMLDFTSF